MRSSGEGVQDQRENSPVTFSIMRLGEEENVIRESGKKQTVRWGENQESVTLWELSKQSTLRSRMLETEN